MSSQAIDPVFDGDYVVDVRSIVPRERHPLIFQTFDSLQPGQTMILVNDHEPRPLYYQFLHERANQFEWVALEEGPQRWQVRITRSAAG
ncbi:MAG: DUF2249 domain-containing protein [Anaerolineae bacterium]